MGDITVTAAQVGLVDPIKAVTQTVIAAAAITKGQVCYIDSNGKANLADANAAGAIQARGIALNAAAAGGAVTLLKEGAVYGFTLSGVAYSGPVYLSNTAGALATSAGGTSVVCGIAVALTDKDLTKVLTKVLYADFRYGPDWS